MWVRVWEASRQDRKGANDKGKQDRAGTVRSSSIEANIDICIIGWPTEFLGEGGRWGCSHLILHSSTGTGTAMQNSPCTQNDRAYR